MADIILFHWTLFGWICSGVLPSLLSLYITGCFLNPTLWFMPVIIGLYLLFPFLVHTLEKRGPLLLLAISVLITYGSIAACIALGYPVSHQSALFSFFVIEFSLGMFIGYRLAFYPRTLGRLLGLKMFCDSICSIKIFAASLPIWYAGWMTEVKGGSIMVAIWDSVKPTKAISSGIK